MKHTTQYKGCQIQITPTEQEDWRGKIGYEVVVSRLGHPTLTSFNNYENASQALAFAKSQIDTGKFETNPLVDFLNSL